MRPIVRLARFVLRCAAAAEKGYQRRKRVRREKRRDEGTSSRIGDKKSSLYCVEGGGADDDGNSKLDVGRVFFESVFGTLFFFECNCYAFFQRAAIIVRRLQ